MMTNTKPVHPTRRIFFGWSLALLGGLFGACGPQPSGTPTSPATTSSPTTSPPGGVTCPVTPQQTDGPFYVNAGLIRRNITEGKVGVPLRLQLTVQRAGTCQPIANATVEVWHCDASGVYSGYGPYAAPEAPPPGSSAPPSGPGLFGGEHVAPINRERFLRGGQVSDATGSVVFQTIYPGWYPGRTPHIHVKVHVNGKVVHTGQMYFDESITDAVYTRQPYAARGRRSTTNATDWIYRSGGPESMLSLSQSPSAGYIGAMALVVSA